MKQLVLSDFYKIANEIKALSLEIIKNRWEIAAKLSIIKEKELYKENYDNFEAFVKDYYGWAKTQAYTYLYAIEFKEKLSKELFARANNLGVTTATQLNVLFQIDETKALELVEQGTTRREVKQVIKELKADRGIGFEERKITPYGENIFYLSELNFKELRGDAYYIIGENDPFPTLKVRSWFYHSDNREFSLREYARVQEFPDDFLFVGSKGSIKKQIGNAVPPLMAKVVAKRFKSCFVVELFAGCGGMSLGFEQAGHKTIFMNERDKDCCYTFRANFKDVIISRKDVKRLEVKEIKKLIGEKSVGLVIGGVPCQGFSVAGFRFKDDSRNELYKEFIRLVKGLQPKNFVMENVMGIKPFKDEIIKDFERIGYKTTLVELKGVDLGMRQRRNRVFFIGENDN